MRMSKSQQKDALCDVTSGKDLEIYEFVSELYPGLLRRKPDSTAMNLFEQSMFKQINVMFDVLKQISQTSSDTLLEVGERSKMTLRGGAPLEKTRGALAGLREQIRGLLKNRKSTRVAHSQLAEKINQNPRHEAMNLVRYHDKDAEWYWAQKRDDSQIPVLWINPFHLTRIDEPQYFGTRTDTA